MDELVTRAGGRAAGKPYRMRRLEVENGRSFEEIVRQRRRDRWSDRSTARVLRLSLPTFYRWCRHTDLYDRDPVTGWLIPWPEGQDPGIRGTTDATG